MGADGDRIERAKGGATTVPSAAHHAPGGGYRNPWPGSAEHGLGGLLRWVIVERLTKPRLVDPVPATFVRAAPAFPSPRAAPDAVVATWVGHSSFLLQIGGRNVLLDPVWGERASPVRFAGPRRWVAPGVDFATLPPVDVVLLSHDHYDHLDDPTVRRLADTYPEAEWLAPLGLAPWLARRGARRVRELDWWESVQADGLAVTATPARHFSGRGMTGRNRRLWCGWTLRAGGRRVFYAGDTALHPEFGRIGERLGPFDLTMFPVGAYEPRWFMSPVHMNPEDALAGYRALVAPSGATPPLVAMHWGTFKLTDEPMDEPPKRLRDAWRAAGLPADALWVLRHGETRAV